MATLAYCGQVKRKAAQILGVSLKTLYNRLETYNGKAEPGVTKRSSMRRRRASTQEVHSWYGSGSRRRAEMARRVGLFLRGRATFAGGGAVPVSRYRGARSRR